MYNNNNNNNSHPDRFAGQYPLPPPLTSPVVEATPHNNTTLFSTPIQHYQETSYNHINYTSSPPAITQQPQPQHYTQPVQQYQEPVLHQEVYIPPPVASYNNYNNSGYYKSQVVPPTPLGEERGGTREQPLEDYLRQEREEYMRHDSNNKSTPYNEYSNVLVDNNEQKEPEKMPMVQKEQESRPSRKERKRIEKLKQEAATTYQPYVTKPVLAPQENEAESYRPRPYEKRDKSCNCCCYNPAITCCSFFCLLISVAFCAAGIAMIIASKVVSDKCNNDCANVIDQAQNACNTICSKVLHDGMLYGGIVVAGLAGIAIIWKLIMWTCAGYSQRR